jgi:hypothetical protein
MTKLTNNIQLQELISLLEKEGDYYEWVTKTGYNAKLKRMSGIFANEPNKDYGGYWCGYVQVPKDHPAYRKHVEHEVFENIEVHDGITYADWEGWIGFACCNWEDIKPYDVKRLVQKEGYLEAAIMRNRHYWTKEEVIAEVEDLSGQLYNVGKK